MEFDDVADATVEGTASPETTQEQDQSKPASEEWRNPEEIKRALKGQRVLKREFGEFRDEVRGLKEKLEAVLDSVVRPQPKQLDDEEQPRKRVRAVDVRDEVLSEVSTLRAELAFRDKLGELETPLNKDQRRLIERLYKAEKPNADELEDWLSDNVRALDVKKPEPKREPPPKAEATQTPPSRPDVRSSLPVDIFAVDTEAWKSLSAAEKKERYEAYKRANNIGTTKFSQLRTAKHGR